jgi:hypothetical protein
MVKLDQGREGMDLDQMGRHRSQEVPGSDGLMKELPDTWPGEDQTSF